MERLQVGVSGERNIFFFPDCSEKTEIVNNCRNHWQPAGGAVYIHNTAPPPGQSVQQQALQLTLQAVTTLAAHPLFIMALADNNANHKTWHEFPQNRKWTNFNTMIPSMCILATKKEARM